MTTFLPSRYQGRRRNYAVRGHSVADMGLLKMDFLGLSNLSVINNALRMIRKVYHDDIDLYNVPLDDPLAYQLLQNAETTGVFQLESAGMKRYLKDLRPPALRILSLWWPSIAQDQCSLLTHLFAENTARSQLPTSIQD